MLAPVPTLPARTGLPVVNLLNLLRTTSLSSHDKMNRRKKTVSKTSTIPETRQSGKANKMGTRRKSGHFGDSTSEDSVYSDG